MIFKLKKSLKKTKNKSRLFSSNSLKNNFVLSNLPIVSNSFQYGSVKLNQSNDISKHIFPGDSGKFIDHQWKFTGEDHLYQIDPKNFYLWKIEPGHHFYWKINQIYFFNQVPKLEPEFVSLIKELFKETIFLEGIIINESHINLIDYYQIGSDNLSIQQRLLELEQLIEILKLKWRHLISQKLNQKITQFPFKISKSIQVNNFQQAYYLYKEALNEGNKGLFLRSGSLELNAQHSNFFVWTPSSLDSLLTK